MGCREYLKLRESLSHWGGEERGHSWLSGFSTQWGVRTKDGGAEGLWQKWVTADVRGFYLLTSVARSYSVGRVDWYRLTNVSDTAYLP